VLSTVKLEARGLPAVTVVTAVFEDLAQRMAEHNQRPDLKVLVMPYPMEDKPVDEVREIARACYPQLVALLGAVR
jgi:hypothetical protein